MKVIGLISLKDAGAFEQYRSQVGATIERYGGVVAFRGSPKEIFWNEIHLPSFDAFVEIDFPDRDSANRWATSPEYQSLIAIRSQAMSLALVGLE